MNLQRQIEELEALRAMYPEDEGCFTMAPAEQQAWAAATAEGTVAQTAMQQNLSGTIRLPDVLVGQQPVALRFQLPPGYPAAEPPLLSVECSASRLIHEQLSKAVREAAEAEVGTESLLVVLDTLREVAAAHTAHADNSPTVVAAAANGEPDNDLAAEVTAAAQEVSSSSSCPHDTLLRAAVWFHHIKNTEKRKNLVAWARELHCSGFSKPGFPGVVVVEGLQADVREYLARVRALQWQAMQVRAEEHVRCAVCEGQGSGTHQQQLIAGVAGRALQGQFVELPESAMSQLGQECKAVGMEGLFLAALKLRK